MGVRCPMFRKVGKLGETGSAAMPAKGDASQHVLAITPEARTTLRSALAELWSARDLVQILVRRDVGVRYKQAVFGFAWAIAQPLAFTVAFSLFLDPGDGEQVGGVDYPVFALAGLVAWSFFASGVNAGSESLLGNEKLISKVYFPRLAIPSSAVLAWLPDLGVALAMLGVTMAIYGEGPALSVLALPAFVALAFLAALGVSTWTSALNVAYRDVRHAVPFLVQFWLFATPGVYSAREFDGVSEVLVALNPATSIVHGFRWSILGVEPPSWTAIGCSAGVIVVILMSGLRYFGRVERYFADVI